MRKKKKEERKSKKKDDDEETFTESFFYPTFLSSLKIFFAKENFFPSFFLFSLSRKNWSKKEGKRVRNWRRENLECSSNHHGSTFEKHISSNERKEEKTEPKKFLSKNLFFLPFFENERKYRKRRRERNWKKKGRKKGGEDSGSESVRIQKKEKKKKKNV